MPRIGLRLLLVFALVVAIAGTVIGVLRLIPSSQSYPIARGVMAVEDVSVPDKIAVEQAENVVLLFGDGMGVSHLTAARITSVGKGGRLAIDKLPVSGMVSTHSADSFITDSAASATAFATGSKTINGAVSMDPTGRVLPTILEKARDAGFATALITTTDISDATPAAFAAHAMNRYDRASIAAQMLDANIDILFGTNPKHFLPFSARGGRRSDGRNLMNEAAERGVSVVDTLLDVRGVERPPLLGLFPETNRPPLQDLAGEALRLLELEGRRFFLLIETEETDSASHDNDLGRTLSAVREFDQTVRVATDWAKRDGSTLVIVAADHETGGLQVIESREKGRIQVIWPTTKHTGQPVPIYAQGPGAELFLGSMDNTDVHDRLTRILGLD